MNTMKAYFKHAINTWADIGGEYYDDVEVLCDYQSRDESCNVGEYVEVWSVKVNGVERVDEMLQSEVESLEERMLQDASDRDGYPHFRLIKRANA